MSQVSEIPSPETLIAYLRAFTRSAQEKGDQLFQQNCIQHLRALEPGCVFAGVVLSQPPNEVRLQFNSGKRQWTGTCTCQMLWECAHTVAVAKSLLAEHSLASVHDLAAGLKVNRAPGAPPSDLATRLGETVGRALTVEEISYLRTIHRLYQRCESNRLEGLTVRDFSELGFRPVLPSWEVYRPWHDFPSSQQSFWQLIAHAAVNTKQTIPPFMEPVTDLSNIPRVLQEERDKKQVAEWQQRLVESVATSLKVAAPATPPIVDVRAVIGELAARLEWKRSGESQFEIPRPQAIRDIQANSPTLLASLPAESEILWRAFLAHLHSYSSEAVLVYKDSFQMATLATLLCRRELAEKIISTDGQPLRHEEEPLRWALLEPESSQPDYRIRLVDGQGRPAPRFLSVFGQNPVFCLCSSAIYQAPTIPSFLSRHGDTRIPAKAVESDAGIPFLRRLGIEIPPRIASRVRSIGVRVTLRCFLDKLYDTEGPEICIVHPTAVSADGLVTCEWTGRSWHKERLELARATSDGDLISVYDEQSLTQVSAALEALGARPAINKSGVYLRVTRAFPEVFSQWIRSFGPDVEVRLDGELNSLLHDAVAGRIRLDVSEADIDWFDLRVVLDIADTTLTPEEVKLLLDAKGGFVRLKHRGWTRLQFDLTPEDDEHLARLGLTARELSSEPQRLHALQLSDPSARRFLPEHQIEQIQRRAAEIQIRVAPDVPPGIQGELRPYQTRGFHFLAYLTENRFGGILADDMGLGKTVQTLAWLVWLHHRWRHSQEAPVPPALVVCPKSVMDNWQAEAKKFAPTLKVRVWAAGELATLPKAVTEAQLHVVNYSQLRSLRDELAGVKWLVTILDEGQYIKNPSSQTAQIARTIRAHHRLILSGTPIENRLLDLWSLMAYAMPGTLGSRSQFTRL